MNFMWLDILIAISCGGGGLVCGWVMHGLHKSTMARSSSHSIAAGKSDSLPSDDPQQQRVSKVRLNDAAANLHSFAINMAADVDAHQTRVQAVNSTLLDQGFVAQHSDLVESVNELISANELMQRQLQSAQDRIHEQTIQLESAEKRAQTDALTRVSNRRAFDDYLTVCHAKGSAATGALMLMDVDHFKQFNDVYGHRAGDEVLRVVAGVLNARLQPFGLVSRFGGEEFAVVLDRMSVDEALQQLEHARLAICQREILFEDQCLRVTACIGVAFLEEGESSEQWLQRADDALYHSKANGRNNGHWMQDDKPVRINASGRGSTSAETTFDVEPKSESAKRASAGMPNSHSTPDDENAGDLATSKSDGKTSDSSATVAQPTPMATNAVSDPRPIVKPEAVAKPVSAVKPKVDAFAYLPDLQTLTESYDELHRRSLAMDMPTHLLAVRFNLEPSSFKMRSLLQVVRASSRNVDKIGCDGDQTLLVVMPSTDESTGLGRARQIAASAKALRLSQNASGGTTGDGSKKAIATHAVSIGVVHSGQAKDFAGMVAAVLEASRVAADASGDPIHVASETTASA